MNPDAPRTPHEELEIKITALLMGQLSAEEAAQVEAQISADPELTALHARLRRAAELLREARTLPEAEAPAVPLQLSKERREQLLATFRGIKSLPKPPKPLLPDTVAPKISRLPVPQKKWGRPFVLAASIAVLVGVSVAWFGSGGRLMMERSRGYASQEPDYEYPKNALAEAPPASSDHSLLSIKTDTYADPKGWRDRSGADRPQRVVVAGLEPNYRWAETRSAGGGMSDPKPTPKANLPGTMTGRMGRGGGGGAPVRAASIYLPPTVAANESAPAASSSSIAVAKDSDDVNASFYRGLAAGEKPAVTTAPVSGPQDEKDMKQAGAAGQPVSSLALNTPQSASMLGEGQKSLEDFGTATFSADGTAVVPSVSTKSGATAVNFGTALTKGLKGAAGAGVPDDALASVPANAVNHWAMEPTVKRELTRRSTRADEEKSKAEGFGGMANGLQGRSYSARDEARFGDAPDTVPSKESGSEAKRETAGVKLPELQLTDQGPLAFAIDGEIKTAQDRYGLEIRKAEEILNKDPNNIAARKTREDLYVKRSEAAAPAAGYSAARSQAMWETESVWERPYRRLDRSSGDTTATGVTALNGEVAEGIKTKDSLATATENFYWDGVANLDSVARQTKAKPTMDGLADGGKALGILRGDQAEGKPQSLYFSGGANFDLGLMPLGNRAPVPPKGPAAKEKNELTDLDTISVLPNLDASATLLTDEFQRFKEAPDPAMSLAFPSLPIPGGVPGQPGTGARPEGEVTAKPGVDPTQEKFVNAFLGSRKAEELAKAGDTEKALQTYRAAAETLEKLKEQSPNWQPEIVEFRLKRTKEAISKAEAKVAADSAKPAAAPPAEPATPVKAPEPPPVPQPEVSTKDNAFSTFSLNVSDVSFQLAKASLDKGKMPEPASVRSEEFINSLDYRDPEPAAGAPLAFASERARYPFAHNRDLLRLSLKTAAAGRTPGRPLNLVLLIDNSGSMERADRVGILKESMRVLTQQLKPEDKLSLITFSRTPRLWADGVAGDKAAEATQRASEITPQGGTDLSAALDLGYKTALKHYNVGSINRVVLLTDGAANLGEVKAEALKSKVEENRKQGVAFDCFGVGWEGYNDDLLEQLSRNGDGRYGFINTQEAATTEFAGQLAGALRVAASDVKVQVEFNPSRVTGYRQVGYAKHQLKKEQFRDNTVDAAEIGAAESGNALYVIEVNAGGTGEIGVARARFKVPGTSDYREQEWTIPYQAPAPAMEQAASSLRLAATASAFSEWLAQSPYAAEVTTDRLLALINGIPAIYGADARPAKLEAMILQAKSISGR